jgi:bacterioferritin
VTGGHYFVTKGIASYGEMVEYFKGFDTTTRKMLKEIQASEEQHADDLAELLENLPKQTGI